MTITFPRAMPASGPANQEFDILRVDFAAPEAGGRIGGVQAGFPLWMATWTLGRIKPAVSDEWSAWIDSLRGSQRTFLSRDYTRPYPREYATTGFEGLSRPGGGAFTGSALSWSQAIDEDKNARLQLTGLPPGLVLSHRDYIGFRWNDGDGDRRALTRVVDPANASSGGLVVVGVEPPLPAWLNSGAVAHLDMPACVMRLIPESTKAAGMDRRRMIAGTKITAVQDLRP